jgi:putative restriction enzyme
MEKFELKAFVQKCLFNYGAEQEKDYILRFFADHEKKGGAFCAIIRSEEATSGVYADLSLVLFANGPDDWSNVLVCLGVGTCGFRFDQELAAQPGVKRMFAGLIKSADFIKHSFLDLESSVSSTYRKTLPSDYLKRTVQKYSKYILAARFLSLSPETLEDSRVVIEAWIAAYSRLREFPSNQTHKSAVNSAYSKIATSSRIDESKQFEKLTSLLKDRRFLVLQGAPGTGKTRMSKLLAKKLDAEVFFTQFHAGTSYSEFIYGIRPSIESNTISYEGVEGPLVKAIIAAQHTSKPVVLIVDEINRANLSSVLGPIFYLFERDMDSSGPSIEIRPKLSLSALPPNFYFIATMNTADRSLAVVDFALRRRFAWYTMRPHKPEKSKQVKDNAYPIGNNILFFESLFEEMDAIFCRYASDEELALQPGQAYFIAHDGNDMQQRLRYELQPLIQEYLAEGLLLNAREEFAMFFRTHLKDDECIS